MSQNTAVLAVHGRAPAREMPITPAGERFGDEEIAKIWTTLHRHWRRC